MLTTDSGQLLGLRIIAILSKNLVVPSDIIEPQQLWLDHFPMCSFPPLDSCSKFWLHISAQPDSWFENCIAHGVFQEAGLQ